MAHPTSPLTTEPDHGSRYELFAVANHMGSLGGGHYTATCRRKTEQGKQAWYSFNDSSVDPIGQDSVGGSKAYVLFYQMSEEP